MRPFRDVPIQRKLMLIITLTGVLALSVACGAFFAFETVAYRGRMVRTLIVRANVIGANTTAALTFQDPKAAEETLATLSNDPRLIAAHLYSTDGRLFASYAGRDPAEEPPSRPPPDGRRFMPGRLEVVLGVFLAGERLGTIYLAQDLRELYRSLAAFGGIAALVLVCASLFALWLSARFQRVVSEPLLELARTAKSISERGDYSVRGIKRSGDETGLLTDSFNAMLDEIQRRDAALRLSLSLQEATLESTADGILVVDAQGRMLGLNRRFTQMWRLPEDVVATRDDDRALAFVLDQLKRPEEFLKRVRELYGRPEEESFDILDFKDGRVFERFSKPQRLGDRIVGRVWSFRDVTERRRAQDELERLARELERRVAERTAELSATNAELESFAYSASHDLRTPLRAIDGFSLVLLEDHAEKLDPRAAELLRRIRSATVRMGAIIDDMLNLARVTRTEMKPREVDVSRLAREVASGLHASEPSRRVEIEIAEGAEAWADEELLRLLLENLLGNAWKFTSQTPRARIEFKVLEREGRRVYVVQDNGAGFDQAYADKLFRPFVRLHAKAEFPGTGVGLATVLRIVQRHGGTAWAEGETGKGASVYFTLEGTRPSAGSPSAPGAAAPDGRRRSSGERP